MPARPSVLFYSSTVLLVLLLAFGQPAKPARAARFRKPFFQADAVTGREVHTPTVAAQDGEPDDGSDPNSAVQETAAPELQLPDQPQAQPAGILTCGSPARIMPLGDSITRGSTSGVSDAAYIVGYRKFLWDSLRNDKYRLDFVGSLSDGSAYKTSSGFDPNHEGHGGWHALGGAGNGIAPNIYNWLLVNPADLILLHIGTNDISNGDQNASDVAAILNEIHRFSPDITVILARIINRNAYSQATTDYNTSVAAMVNGRPDKNKIIVVDMENGAGIDYRLQPVGDMYDSIHPFATGYSKMAVVWEKALLNLLPYCALNDSFKVNEDSGITSLNVLSNDQGHVLSLSSVGEGLQGGTLSLDGDRIDYTPAPDFFGTETFTYTINSDLMDPAGSDLTATVTVTVKEMNDPPTAVDDSYEVNEDENAIFDVLGNDTIAPDEGETLTITGTGIGSGGGSISTDGEKIFYTPSPDFSGSETFPYTVNDGTQDSDATAAVTVTITPLNDPPRVIPPAAQKSNEGDAVSLQIQASDLDDMSLTYSAAGLPPGLSIDPHTGLVSGSLTAISSGSYLVKVTVSDSAPDHAVTVEFKWQVANTMHPLFLPVIGRRAIIPNR